MVSQGDWVVAIPHKRVSINRWALGIAALTLFLTGLPYLLGFSSQGRDWRFTGFVFAVEDGNSYIAKMQAGAAGSWLFRTPYSPVQQDGVVAFLPYILLGKLASAPEVHLQLVVLFHLLRIFAGLLSILATYDFIAYFISNERQRRYGLVLAVLGGGLGWLLLILGRDTWLGSMPLEFYSPETFGFLEIFGLPHLALARAGMLWGLLIYLRSTRELGRESTRAAAGVGILWLLVALCQPLTALCMAVIIGLHLTTLAAYSYWRDQKGHHQDWAAWRGRLGFAAKAFLIPAPFLIYNVLAFSLDPFLKSWTAQNLILSPPLPHYLLAYGVLLPFLPLGMRNLLHQNAQDGWLLVVWILATPLLAYAPVNLQRRLLEGVWIAMIVVALWSLRREGQPGVNWRLFFYTTLLVFPSTLILLGGSLITAVQPGLPVFQPSDEVTVFERLGDHAIPGAVVMASYQTGNALPAWSPLRVVVGHGPESAGLDRLLPLVQRFFDAAPQTRNGMPSLMN
jgi:hypothetical protein